MEEERPAAKLLINAYNSLKASDAQTACQFLEDALKLDYESKEIKCALKCVSWWLEQCKKLLNIKDPYEKGGMLISLLKPYQVFLAQLSDNFEQCQYAIRSYVYSNALENFKGLLGILSNQHDPHLLLMVGRCYKGLGLYDEALNYLEQAVRFKREDAETLAEVADINALLAETKTAKMLFREAFFLDPAKIDMGCMESALINQLRDNVSALGFSGDETAEWIPVYGYLWGVFSVKREMKQVEVGKLKQSIFSLEAEREANPDRRDFLKPRLINRYFWLIDYYENVHEDPVLIEETLLKIKVTDPEIYQRYTA
jgi:tetratricopeptide (TPR) repeat protein